jgi:hypothetical protein
MVADQFGHPGPRPNHRLEDLLDMSFSSALRAFGPALLLASVASGCLTFNSSTGGGDQPGHFSFYSEMNFRSQDLSSFCLQTSDTNCQFFVNNHFAQPLITADNWTINNGLTDGAFGTPPPTWSTPTQAGMIIGDTSELIYIGSHGLATNGQSTLCLQYCVPGSTQTGGDVAVGTPDIPAAWQGPAWLILDACEDVQPNVGWEGVFGGSLHGILGWSSDVQPLTTSGMDAVVSHMGQFDTAQDTWLAATTASAYASFAAMLIPQLNTSDVIEARGGPHYGLDGDTNPVYYQYVPNQGFQPGPITTLSTAPSSGYLLDNETMNQTDWINQYGGNNVPHTVRTTANADIWSSAGAIVHNFTGTGGVLVSTPSTGTAQGFSAASALQYAQQWLTSNGGLPSDAVLTYEGIFTEKPQLYQSVQGAPYPNNLNYLFIWRHGSSALLGADKISVTVDDSGGLTAHQGEIERWDPSCGCYHEFPYTYYGPPWVPQYHTTKFSRLWRAVDLRKPLSGMYHRRAVRHHTGHAQTPQYAYCATDMGLLGSSAVPCQVSTSQSASTYADLSTQGYIDEVTEPL